MVAVVAVAAVAPASNLLGDSLTLETNIALVHRYRRFEISFLYDHKEEDKSGDSDGDVDDDYDGDDDNKGDTEILIYM